MVIRKTVVITALALVATGCGTTEQWTPPVAAPSGSREVPDIQLVAGPTVEGFFKEDIYGVRRGQLASDFAFESGSAHLGSNGIGEVEEVANELAGYSGTVCIEGRADGVGPALGNLNLSQRRADSVAAVLTGLWGGSIQAIGRGEEGATPGVSDANWRRVDISQRECE